MLFRLDCDAILLMAPRVAFISYLLVMGSVTWAYKDSDHEALLKKLKVRNHNAVIYTWSPHMVLSQKGLRELFARKWSEKIEIRVLLDPDCDLKFARQIAAKNGWPDSVLERADAKDLWKIGVRVHYPAYVFLKGSKKPKLIPGYKTPGALDRLVKRYL